ncbi:DUF1854 domain-containing protein [Hydrogenophaga sp.]|uniref:cyanophycin metabolism-associated DUF1854 family protein n=1 Tax=Hydrogenophaga sp. TaxID=1904254 RepID=UPI002603F372|nr:DUF1854 domain-containing protein [Hydrogenophaga sp.]MCW5655716.1 DUF1854 domain-containing protein [Hydrogenophaga sp.]
MNDTLTPTLDWRLHRDNFGQLVFTDARGTEHAGVAPVRAFPVSAPDEGLSLVGADGHELLWLERLSTLPQPVRSLLEETLSLREFAPVIRRILAVSTFSTPSTWTVDTDRGETQFVLRSEDDIRRLEGQALLILSSHGVSFTVRDRLALDRPSRRLLERFL